MACGFSILAMTGTQHALLAHDPAHVLDVGGAERTKDSAMKSTVRCRREAQVLDVLLRHRRHAHRDAGQVDALVVADPAAVDHLS